MFFALLIGHAIADFPLQAGPMATEKCRRSTSGLQKAVPWYYWLTAHALIHGGFVYWITGSLFLGLMETVVHWFIDFGKCEGWFGIHVDQALHVACKALWWALIWQGVAGSIDLSWPVIPVVPAPYGALRK